MKNRRAKRNTLKVVIMAAMALAILLCSIPVGAEELAMRTGNSGTQDAVTQAPQSDQVQTAQEKTDTQVPVEYNKSLKHIMEIPSQP